MVIAKACHPPILEQFRSKLVSIVAGFKITVMLQFVPSALYFYCPRQIW